MHSMDTGLAVAQRASTALDKIADAIEDTRRISLEVAAVTLSMQSTSRDDAANMDNVSAVVEQNVTPPRESSEHRATRSIRRSRRWGVQLPSSQRQLPA
jgi:methyl-accepting chemotaxis protein